MDTLQELIVQKGNTESVKDFHLFCEQAMIDNSRPTELIMYIQNKMILNLLEELIDLMNSK